MTVLCTRCMWEAETTPLMYCPRCGMFLIFFTPEIKTSNNTNDIQEEKKYGLKE